MQQKQGRGMSKWEDNLARALAILLGSILGGVIVVTLLGFIQLLAIVVSNG